MQYADQLDTVQTKTKGPGWYLGRACRTRAAYHAVLGVKGSRETRSAFRQTLDTSTAAWGALRGQSRPVRRLQEAII
jgi:hypothetical protein